MEHSRRSFLAALIALANACRVRVLSCIGMRKFTAQQQRFITESFLARVYTSGDLYDTLVMVIPHGARRPGSGFFTNVV
jgi:hypothetical protein